MHPSIPQRMSKFSCPECTLLTCCTRLFNCTKPEAEHRQQVHILRRSCAKNPLSFVVNSLLKALAISDPKHESLIGCNMTNVIGSSIKKRNVLIGSFRSKISVPMGLANWLANVLRRIKNTSHSLAVKHRNVIGSPILTPTFNWLRH